MISIRKSILFFLLLISSIFFLQNCGSIIYGTFQKIPTTSNPPGAKVVVEGKVKGFTPLNLHLKKTKSHVIRIEKEGYNPLEIKITRESSSKGGLAVTGDVLAAVVAAFIIGKTSSSYEYDNGDALFMPKFIWGICFIGLVALDYSGGGLYKLSPAELQVMLTKKEEQARLDYIILNARQLKNVRWIRIKCSDGWDEDLINLN